MRVWELLIEASLPVAGTLEFFMLDSLRGFSILCCVSPPLSDAGITIAPADEVKPLRSPPAERRPLCYPGGDVTAILPFVNF